MNIEREMLAMILRNQRDIMRALSSGGTTSRNGCESHYTMTDAHERALFERASATQSFLLKLTAQEAID